MAMTLLIPRQVDQLLRYPRGRSMKLAKAGKLPHVTLPDGEVRFLEAEIEQLILKCATAASVAPSDVQDHDARD